MSILEAVGGNAADALRRAVQRAAGSPAIPGNGVSLLIDGPDTYAVMHEMISSARHRIHFENYIIRDDATGGGFADALIAKAQAGVRVRVLYDWLGSFGTPRRFWQRLREAGVEVHGFGPPAWRDPLLVGSRDHRKVFVVDGVRGVTGGLCVGDEWVGDTTLGRLPWRDTAIRIDGPGARSLDTAFERSWRFAGGSPIADDEVGGDVPAGGETDIRVVATEPGRERAYRTIDLLLGVSSTRIWVTEAYLAAPQRLYQAFIDAARDGVDVRLLLPGSSDIRMVRDLSRVGYRALLKAGVRIWEWQGPMLHAKTIVADGRWVRVGSSNLNASSLLANWELDVFVDDRTLGVALEHQFLTDLAQASEVVLRPRRVPALLDQMLPGGLTREKPHAAVPVRHVRTFRERRRQAIVTVGGLVRGARAAVFGPLALVLLACAALFVLFPVPAAYVAAAAALAAGSTLAVRALAYRGRG